MLSAPRAPGAPDLKEAVEIIANVVTRLSSSQGPSPIPSNDTERGSRESGSMSFAIRYGEEINSFQTRDALSSNEQRRRAREGNVRHVTQ
jgi:hypothetical protein